MAEQAAGIVSLRLNRRAEANTIDPTEREKNIKDQISAWTQRQAIANKLGQDDVAAAAQAVVSAYTNLLDSAKDGEPEMLLKANVLRKRIEASEQHRTMCVEHGLSNAAIDATYEIQELERQLVALINELS